jgi:hypothetical protein
VAKGEVNFQTGKNKSSKSLYFLFNDLIVITNEEDEEGKFKYLASLPLKDTMISNTAVPGEPFISFFLSLVIHKY